MDISIISVNYMVPHLVKGLFESIQKNLPSGTWEMIVIDNSKDDDKSGILNELAGTYDNFILVSPGKNLGFGAGNNLGVERARGRYLVFLNPDVIVEDGCIDGLVAHLDSCPECGIAAPRVCWGDGTFQPTARAFPNPLTGIFGRATILTRLFPNNPLTKKQLIDLEHAKEPGEIDWAAGMAWAVRKDQFIESGGWDERYFMYWEDADVALNYKRKFNLCTHYIPDSGIIHYHAESSSKAGSRATRVFHDSAYKYVVKNIYPNWYDPRRWLSWLALKMRESMIILKNRLRG